MTPSATASPVRDTERGTLLALHVAPGAKKAGVRGIHGDRIRLAVSAPAVDGRANDALCDLLAELLRVPRRSVQLLQGAASRQKSVLVEGLSASEVTARLGLSST